MKYFILVLALGVLVVSTRCSSDVTTPEEISDSLRRDSLLLAARVAELESRLKFFDDTLSMAKLTPSFVKSVGYTGYYNTGVEPHPEIAHRECPFFVDTVYRTDTTLKIELFGTLSGGNPPGGTACLRGDTLILIYGKEPQYGPAVGSYFKWSLNYELSIADSVPLPVIITVNRDRCYYRRQYFIEEHGFQLLKKSSPHFLSLTKKARQYHPGLSCLSVGCPVLQSYRAFPDTAGMILRKNPQLIDFSYSYPEFTPEEIKGGHDRAFVPYTIRQKIFEDDTLTITISGNTGWLYKQDGNILIDGDTIFLISWQSNPEDISAPAIHKNQLSYTIAVPKKKWHFKSIELNYYVDRNEEWFRTQVQGKK